MQMHAKGKLKFWPRCTSSPLGPAQSDTHEGPGAGYLSGVAVAHPKIVKSGKEVRSDGEDLSVELGGPRHGGSSGQEDDSPGSLGRRNKSIAGPSNFE